MNTNELFVIYVPNWATCIKIKPNLRYYVISKINLNIKSSKYMLRYFQYYIQLNCLILTFLLSLILQQYLIRYEDFDGNCNDRWSRQADMATTAERWRQLDSLTKWLHTYIHWNFDAICLVILYLERYWILISTDSIIIAYVAFYMSTYKYFKEEKDVRLPNSRYL